MNLSYFKTLAEVDGYIIETIPWVGYIKENDQVLYCWDPCKMVIIQNNHAIVHDTVDVIFETLNDADGYIIETIPFSCYILENCQLLECNQQNCKIVVESGVAVIKERGDIIRYTATSKVEPYKLSSLPTIISNDFDLNTEQGVIKFATDVTSIGQLAFYYSTGLTSIEIPNSVTSIGNSAFSDCVGLTSITIPNSVNSIEHDAFYKCSGLTSVTIPNSVTGIGDSAFAFTGLTSIEIPNSVTSIGDDVFVACGGLTSINVASDNPNYCSVNGVLFNKNRTTLISYPSGKQGAYTIPNSVTSIGQGAFSGCRGLISVTIPNSVTSIGNYAFSKCTGLTSLTIGNSVTSIGKTAFYDCRSLSSISYTGTISQYNSISKSINWNAGVPATQVYCLGENPPTYTPI